MPNRTRPTPTPARPDADGATGSARAGGAVPDVSAVGTFSATRRHWLLRAAAGVPLVAGAAARAAPGGLPSAAHGDGSPEWERLRARLFGDRRPEAGSGLIRLQAPLRAAYGASVPVTLRTPLRQHDEPWVRRLWLMVDKNPSPLAATLTLTRALGQADFETRLRVDEYGHVRVVAELSDGSLHTDSRYVKTSGGCSAPPNRESPETIGRTTLRLTAPWQPGGLNAAEVTVMHPNDTGFELNQQTVMYIPPWFVRRIRVLQDGRPLFDSEQDFSCSENPGWRFHFHDSGGALQAEVEDTQDQRHAGRLALA